MAAARLGLRYALSQPRIVELCVDPQTSHELADQTLAVAVVSGIPRLLPARLDPWFRRRLKRARLAEGMDADRLGWIGETKLGAILRILPPPTLVQLTAIDLDRCRPRIELAGGRRPGDSAARAPEPGRWTSELILIGVGDARADTMQAVRVGCEALVALCGARVHEWRSVRIVPSEVSTVVLLTMTT